MIDAAGRLVLPGFIDAHNHVRLGSDDACVQLAGVATLDGIHARVRAWADAHPDAEWIEAEAFDHSAIPGGRMPHAGDLDPVTGDRPAFVLSHYVHTAWLNTRPCAGWASTVTVRGCPSVTPTPTRSPANRPAS
ncbi:amidohydrolase family protein [Streptomyces sp. NPDC052676]|uniref:amidohydrolase family protein n=1 Tax=Streptomyces sp. NPDC052676 TaxID=3154953 RepID=UPI0034404D3F